MSTLEKKLNINFSIYFNLCQYHRQTDGRTDGQNYSSEPQKKKFFVNKLLLY